MSDLVVIFPHQFRKKPPIIDDTELLKKNRQLRATRKELVQLHSFTLSMLTKYVHLVWNYCTISFFNFKSHCFLEVLPSKEVVLQIIGKKLFYSCNTKNYITSEVVISLTDIWITILSKFFVFLFSLSSLNSLLHTHPLDSWRGNSAGNCSVVVIRDKGVYLA